MESNTSINQEAVRQAISIMERVVSGQYRFSMCDWSDTFAHGMSALELRFMTESSARERGIAASFGGWVALSPEWNAAGGSKFNNGMPILRVGQQTYVSAEAIAKWLNISKSQAALLTCIGSSVDKEDRSNFYGGKKLTQITPSDVLDKLKVLLH